MKIALLSFDFPEYCINLANGLSTDAEVLLLLPDQLVAPHLSRLVREVQLTLFRKPRLRQPIRQMGMVLRILTEIDKFGPDIVHFQHWHLWFNLALPLLNRFPLVVTIHDLKPHVGDKSSEKTPQIIVDLGYRCADQLIVHANGIKAAAISQYGFPAEMVHVIPHIVLGDDTDQCHVPEEDNLILFFGRIWAYKGLEYLIRAEPLITAQVPGAKIAIVGNGEDFNAYRRKMVHPENFLIQNEYVCNEDRAAWFHRAAVLVLPYVDASQSGVIPVAYRFSKPVVATTVGSLSEMVDDGSTGYLVAPRDEVSLAEAIVRLLNNPSERRRMGANGKSKIEKECSSKAIGASTMQVYRYAVDRKGSRQFTGMASNGSCQRR